MKPPSPFFVLISLPFFFSAACDESTTSAPSLALDAGSPVNDSGTASDVGPEDTATPIDAGNDVEIDAGPKTFDLTADFPSVTNPTAPWTLGWSATLGGSVTVYSVLKKGTNDSPAWQDPVVVSLDAPSAWKNLSTSAAAGNPPGSVAMHPGASSEYSVARFTAPLAGTYSGAIKLFAGDSGETVATVYVNGTATNLGVTSVEPSFAIPARG